MAKPGRRPEFINFSYSSSSFDIAHKYQYEEWNKSKSPYSKIKKGSEITLLLHCKELEISSSICQLTWDVVQMKLHRVSSSLKNYSIRED